MKNYLFLFTFFAFAPKGRQFQEEDFGVKTYLTLNDNLLSECVKDQSDELYKHVLSVLLNKGYFYLNIKNKKRDNPVISMIHNVNAKKFEIQVAVHDANELKRCIIFFCDGIVSYSQSRGGYANFENSVVSFDEQGKITISVERTQPTV